LADPTVSPRQARVWTSQLQSSRQPNDRRRRSRVEFADDWALRRLMICVRRWANLPIPACAAIISPPRGRAVGGTNRVFD
jgi:hypothetical protein